MSSLGHEQFERARQMLDELQSMPLWAILLTFAVVPAVFEEFFFRGFLFSALRSAISGWQTILATAILFGLFHEVLGPGRFLASASLGLVLGWVRLRTGSVLPCMVLHLLHNGLLAVGEPLARNTRDRRSGMAELKHLPSTWLAAAVVGIVRGGRDAADVDARQSRHAGWHAFAAQWHRHVFRLRMFAVTPRMHATLIAAIGPAAAARSLAQPVRRVPRWPRPRSRAPGWPGCCGRCAMARAFLRSRTAARPSCRGSRRETSSL